MKTVHIRLISLERIVIVGNGTVYCRSDVLLAIKRILHACNSIINVISHRLYFIEYVNARPL